MRITRYTCQSPPPPFYGVGRIEFSAQGVCHFTQLTPKRTSLSGPLPLGDATCRAGGAEVAWARLTRARSNYFLSILNGIIFVHLERHIAGYCFPVIDEHQNITSGKADPLRGELFKGVDLSP